MKEGEKLEEEEGGEGREAAYLESQGYSCCPPWRHHLCIRQE